MHQIEKDEVEPFIEKWARVEASEVSTSQSFLTDLCRLLGVPTPHPTVEQDYMFERPVTFSHGDGSSSPGRIDLYRRGAFVLESKKLRPGLATKGFDEALLRARSQAEGYARALPAAEGRPPFVIVVDVGSRIELYSEFSRSGATYIPFPDPRSHRITLDELRAEVVRDRLRQVWLNPMALDPSRESAKVTREIASGLAELAKSLERSGHRAELVAQFLMRCLFTMFSEDVRLLPESSFRDLLQRYKDKPSVAMSMVRQLWQEMDRGGFSAVLASEVLRFNGTLFKNPDTLPLTSEQIDLLAQAARAKWEHVEPAIFGTLLERALEPSERHKLGAHYTPRSYVERLVLPAVIEPLRKEWSDSQAAALTLAAEDKSNEAVHEILGFHHRLCNVRVLDPACGSGNFLYVTLEHLKRLEGEVLNALDELGYRQADLAIAGERADAQAGETVDPHNLLGIELNPRAAAIAEVVLWIGYLQWHFRTRGDVNPPTPVIRDFRNIENRDAMLEYDKMVYVTDDAGRPVTRWDGSTMRTSEITGEKVPDESSRVPVEYYVNARRAAWPRADFVVGNPPFIGNKRMREALGSGYVEALRTAWPEVPESADLVMYWWHHAACLVRQGELQRFGLITTSSIRQSFNRRVLKQHLSDKKNPISLVFAIPDHPWDDASDSAGVRIAMTVGSAGIHLGRKVTVPAQFDDSSEVEAEFVVGRIHADLSVGANVVGATRLLANRGISGQGIKLVGDGFYVKSDSPLQGNNPATGMPVVRTIIGPKDVLNGTSGKWVVDFFGLSEAEARAASAEAYQKLLVEVKPLRDQNARASIRDLWWKFAWDRPVIRSGLHGISRYIVTLETTKHRAFTFVPADSLWDGSLFGIAIEDARVLGVLSSAVHVVWVLAAGSELGPTPRYNNTLCFEPFPFPDYFNADYGPGHAGGERGSTSSGPGGGELSEQIRVLGEAIDAHRKCRQKLHPGLTLTDMYNVLEKLRSGEPLTLKERDIHERGLVSILRELHDDLDARVLSAYGWDDLLPILMVAHGNASDADMTRGEAKSIFDERVLDRLVALNTQRSAEEGRGLVQWLRPDFQGAGAVSPEEGSFGQGELHVTGLEDAAKPAKSRSLAPWPKEPVAQVRAVAGVLAASVSPVSVGDVAAQFTARGPWKRRLPQLLDMLVAVGRAKEKNGLYSLAG